MPVSAARPIYWRPRRLVDRWPAALLNVFDLCQHQAQSARLGRVVNRVTARVFSEIAPETRGLSLVSFALFVVVLCESEHVWGIHWASLSKQTCFSGTGRGTANRRRAGVSKLITALLTALALWLRTIGGTDNTGCPQHAI